MSIINSSNVRRAVKFAGACLAVDAIIEMATSYEAGSAYEFASLMDMRSRARKANLPLQPMTRKELWERARCNVGTFSIAKRDLRKEGKHSAILITWTLVKKAEGHYGATQREVTNFVGGENSAKEYIESQCSSYNDGRVVRYRSCSGDYAFISFDGEKPNAWTDAIIYELKII